MKSQPLLTALTTVALAAAGAACGGSVHDRVEDVIEAALIEAVPRFTGPVPTRLSEVSAEPVCRLWPAKVSRAARATPPDTRWTQPRVGARGNQAPSHERHAAAQAAWRPRGPRAESCGVGPQVIGVVVGSGAASQGAESRSPRVVRA